MKQISTKEGYSKQRICMILKLNLSTVYRHRQLADKPVNPMQSDLVERVKNIFKMTGANYVSRRIRHVLATPNIYVGRCRVRSIMKAEHLKTMWTHAFIRTTDSQHSVAVADNLLKQDFNLVSINKLAKRCFSGS